MSVVTTVRTAWTFAVRGQTGARPRAVWRVALPLAAVLGLGAVLTALLGAVLPDGARDSLGAGVLSDALVALVVLVVVVVSARGLDRRPASEYGFELSRRWWADFGAGGALGVALVAAAFAAGHALGEVAVVNVVSPGDAGSFAPWFLLFGVGYLCTAFWEETLFRGLVLTNAAEGLAARGLSPRNALIAAVSLTAMAFGVVHAPFSVVPGGTSLAGMLVVWTLMGGLLGFAAAASGRLAFPMGLHLTVNYAINNAFFGTDVAGLPAPPTLLRTTVTAPELWHPLGGLPMVGAILVGYALTAGWFRCLDGEVGLVETVATRDP